MVRLYLYNNINVHSPATLSEMTLQWLSPFQVLNKLIDLEELFLLKVVRVLIS